MKILSETVSGGRVVELTENEYKEFNVLAKALEGKTIDEMRGELFFKGFMRNAPVEYEVNFNGVFGAIRAFYEASFHLNGLKQLVSNYEKFVPIKKE